MHATKTIKHLRHRLKRRENEWSEKHNTTTTTTTVQDNQHSMKIASMLSILLVAAPRRSAAFVSSASSAFTARIGGISNSVIPISSRKYSRTTLSMKLQTAIVGLPNVGKSTLFNALTETQGAEAANYPFCTIEPNVCLI